VDDSQGRLLIVEDDSALRRSLRTTLDVMGFDVGEASNGEEGLVRLRMVDYEAVLLDINMPGMGGIETCRRIRRVYTKMPIVMLTVRDSEDDKVEALEAGADDYVTKPFHFEEVLARLQALLRRAGGWATPQLRCGPVVLDTRAQTIQVDGAPVELTTFEYRILEHLMLRAGDVISKTELTERLYDQDFERDSNVIEVLVGRLRRKLDPQDRLRPIETLRGRGYRFALPRDASS